MNFSNELNNYLKLLNCSATELSKSSGLSATIISRYLNNKRTPRPQSEYFNKLVEGIYKISIKKNIPLNKSDIYNNLNKTLSMHIENYDYFINNFNLLLSELKINISDIANSLGYDTSFISKVKNKTRKPSDLNSFSKKIGDYIVENFNTDDKKIIISNIIQSPKEQLENNTNYKESISRWLISYHNNNDNLIEKFLTKLDTFELNNYTGTKFKKTKVPTSPIILKNSKVFYGQTGRKKSEAEFLKTTLLSKSKEPIFFYSNLPISQLGEDNQYKNKWVFAMNMILKKGLHLNIIHDIDRPLNEMLLGLENWIPLYMTGNISPYYFKEPPSNIFLQSLCISGSVCLSGDYIKDSAKHSRFYLSTKKDDIIFYQKKANYMLSKAKPLMIIYKENDKEKFNNFLKKHSSDTIKKIHNNHFKNIDFYVNKNKWISINKKNDTEIHFVIYNFKLRKAIEAFL